MKMPEQINIVDALSQNDFIAFVGTGVEKPAGVSGWNELLIKLLKEMPSNKSKKDEELKDDIDKSKPWDKAQEVFNELKENGQEQKYYDIISEGIKPKESDWTQHQLDIADVTRWIITTNYGSSLEHSIKRLIELTNSRNIYDEDILPKFRLSLPKDKYLAVYLHGKTIERCIIFNKDEYESYYPNEDNSNQYAENIKDYLKHIYTNNIIVFIGFSFEDEYFLRLLKIINNAIIKDDLINSRRKEGYEQILPNIKHYAYITEIKKDDIEGDEKYKEQKYKHHLNIIAELKSLNIEVILLQKDEHIKWTADFKNIRLSRRELSNFRNIEDIFK